MEKQLKVVEEIVSSEEDPTFENTVVALERSGIELMLAFKTFNLVNMAARTESTSALAGPIGAKYAMQQDKIKLNARLFERLQALYRKRGELGLPTESVYLLERYFKDFQREGIGLPDAAKARLTEINAELASLREHFKTLLTKGRNAQALIVDSEEDLLGLSKEGIASAREEARKRGHEGKYAITLDSSGRRWQSALCVLQKRTLREELVKLSATRNMHGEFDTRPIITKIARLRAEKADLMGHPHYCSLNLQEMAIQTYEAADKFLSDLIQPAVQNFHRDVRELQEFAEKTGATHKLEEWDYRYYAEKLRQERYAYSEEDIKPYFELETVLWKGVFHTATQLYGLTFKERLDLPVYHEDVRIFEVFDSDGTPIALFVGDYLARPSKRGGACNVSISGVSRMAGAKPVLANFCSFHRRPDGKVLMTDNEVRTAFHEFGHALHYIFTGRSVEFPKFSSVVTDFVELPSQLNETWRYCPEVLANFAVHHETGEPLPATLLQKVTAATGFSWAQETSAAITVMYLASCKLDHAWHTLKLDDVPTPEKVEDFERNALERAGFAGIFPSFNSRYFLHIWSHEHYATRYYSYMYCKVLDADAQAWFMSNGGLTRANGERFRSKLLEKGSSGPELELFREFTGRNPDVKPLLKRIGLA
eukprot:TRINITY_DN31541_c0_g1_i1.p1 TRINITY_DN31541_c0_g1~~TRINITY_DN31541_c0_g1_i1.p1  ORF type:complete len:744 (+),score=113.03 TRINITY_DN31541_c0_g1_i1:279-2234(+)